MDGTQIINLGVPTVLPPKVLIAKDKNVFIVTYMTWTFIIHFFIINCDKLLQYFGCESNVVNYETVFIFLLCYVNERKLFWR